MPRRVLQPLVVALGGTAGLLLVWVLAYRVAGTQALDGDLFRAITDVRGSDRARAITGAITMWMYAPIYALLALWVCARAWARRGPAVAIAAGGLLAVANVAAQLLKHATAAFRPDAITTWGDPVDLVSWPSGHATASTALVVAAVLAASPARRRLVAWVGGVWALAVGISVVQMTWHMPSDVLGGWCLVAAVGGLAVAGLRAYEAWDAPGVHRTSSLPFTARARMNSRSESRLR